MSEIVLVATTGDGILQRLDRGLLAIPKSNLAAAIIATQGLLFYGDFLTGPWVPFGVFYLLTLYIAVKYLGVRTAYAMAFIVVLGKTFIRTSHIPIDLAWWQILWQFLSSYSIYSFFCYLINAQLTARKRAEAIAVQATHRAGEAERKLLNISEETQQRIGRELHDDLGQHLTGIAFMTQVLSQKLSDAGLGESTEAERLTLMLNQAISKTRNMAHGLYPAELEEHGLNSMLEKFAGHAEAMYRINCVFSCDRHYLNEDQEVAIQLFRITQEAVNNAVKHGRATRILLRMSGTRSLQTLEILDNGCGLDSGVMLRSTGLGLRSMRYRAEMIGATLDISARSEGGTRVAISMPIKQ